MIKSISTKFQSDKEIRKSLLSNAIKVTEQDTRSKQVNLVKNLIWTYFWLLIFEGALRKWFLPALATPLLIIRDPIAILMIAASWKYGLVKFHNYVKIIWVLTGISMLATMLIGHGNLQVAIYGARILLFHFPVMFIMGKLLTREDLLKLGKATVILSIFMALLISMQFYSPQSALVNRGVGGDMAGAGFDGANGYFRPPGTFSFTNGTHMFFGLAACFIFYFWTDPKKINKLVLLAATGGLLISIPFSISRSLLLYIVVAFIFTAIALLHKIENIKYLLIILVAGLIGIAALSKVKVLQAPLEAFTSRFENASAVEGGLKGSLGDRYLGGMIGPFMNSFNTPVLGYGMGMGTNAGNKMLTGSTTGYLISEGEWGRLIGEMGAIMGVSIIFIRLSFCIKVAIAAYRSMLKQNLLAWILLGNCLLTIPQAQWAQPTSLGFSTIIGGLILAALKKPVENNNTDTRPEQTSPIKYRLESTT